jgi:hypothetical protein
MKDLQKVTLSTLNGGLLEEMFQEAREKVVDSFNDDNYKPDAVREIAIRIIFKPTISNKGVRYDCGILAEAKLPKRLGHAQRVYPQGLELFQGEDPEEKQIELDHSTGVHKLPTAKQG